MANRIRSMKPEILEDEKTAFLSHLEYRLFTGSWIIADDYGNMRGDPDYLRCQIIWAAKETRETVADALDQIVRVGLIDRYTVRGQTYYHIVSFAKHQRIDKPGKPKCPGPDQSDGSESTADNRSRNHSQNDSTNDSRTGRDSLPTSQGPGIREREVEWEGEREGVREISAPATLPDQPRRVTRKRKTRIPNDWAPAPEQRAQAVASRLDCDHQAQKFIRHYRASGRPYVNWDETFAAWLERELEYQSRGRGPPQSGSQAVLGNLLTDIARLEREEADKTA